MLSVEQVEMIWLMVVKQMEKLIKVAVVIGVTKTSGAIKVGKAKVAKARVGKLKNLKNSSLALMEKLTSTGVTCSW